ncbi:MAG: L-threonylcarbamoyladenylate synthase [Lachnospiraceae bacterium]|nr:L-threonylcarbamoyladenylate synthase [Lachnospiraceae bacterium]
MNICGAEKIKNGEVLRVPTDTVYGYVCDAGNKLSIEKIYDLKKRDKKKPLGIFVHDIDDFYKIVDGGEGALSDDIKEMLKKYWPGALTVICKKRKDVLPFFNDGLDTIGVRVPKDDRLLNLMKESGCFLAQTSANISGESDISSSEIDGKDTKASTIIDITSGNIEIVRQGDIVL